MNKPNPDADLLRRAATLARETAQAATEGPWTPERKGVLDPDDIQFVETTRRDASHIALWHPGVALAVATWLEDVADLHEPHASAYGCDWCSDEDWPCADTRNALAVARTLLGEDTE